MRTLVDIPDTQLRALTQVCERERMSRAAAIRAAIAAWLAEHHPDPADDAFGLWGTPGTDGLDYQEKLRSEW